MRSRANGLVLLASKDINTDNSSLSMSVLTGLGGGNISDLAGLSINNNEISLADLPALRASVLEAPASTSENSSRSDMSLQNKALIKTKSTNSIDKNVCGSSSELLPSHEPIALSHK